MQRSSDLGARLMRKAEDHLLKPSAEAGSRDLSGLTGLARLSLIERVLEAAEQTSLPSGREQFIYVLNGAGELTSKNTETATSAAASLGTGDFVALEATEEAVITAGTESLTLLIGRGPRPR